MSNCQLYTFTANYRWRPQRVQKLRPLHLNFSLVFFSLYYASIAFTRAQPWWKEFPRLSTWSCALCELGCLYGHSFCYCWWCSPQTLSSHCFASFPYFKSMWMLPDVSSLLTVWHSIVGSKVRIQELYHLVFFFFFFKSRNVLSKHGFVLGPCHSWPWPHAACRLQFGHSTSLLCICFLGTH